MAKSYEMDAVLSERMAKYESVARLLRQADKEFCDLMKSHDLADEYVEKFEAGIVDMASILESALGNELVSRMMR